jgi:hypothetical protein
MLINVVGLCGRSPFAQRVMKFDKISYQIAVKGLSIAWIIDGICIICRPVVVLL